MSGITENHFSKHLSKKDRFLERYKTFLYTPTETNQNLMSKNRKKVKIFIIFKMKVNIDQ